MAKISTLATGFMTLLIFGNAHGSDFQNTKSRTFSTGTDNPCLYLSTPDFPATADNSIRFTSSNSSLIAKNSISLDSRIAGGKSKSNVSYDISYIYNAMAGGSAHSGSLKIEGWAVPRNGMIGNGTVGGQRLFVITPTIKDSQGSLNDFIYNGIRAWGSATTQATNPPAGKYCLALTLREYNTAGICKNYADSNGYCQIAWVLLDGANIEFTQTGN